MNKLFEKTALLCIDLQREYFNEGRQLKVPESDEVMKNCKLLLKFFRKHKGHVIHIKHESSNPDDSTFMAGSPFTDFADSEASPQGDELLIIKHKPSAFHDTDLDAILNKSGIQTLIISGLLSFMCCDTTSRDAHAKGYNVIFVNDATAAIDIGGVSADEIHKVTCSVQSWIFATVKNTRGVLDIFKISGGGREGEV